MSGVEKVQHIITEGIVKFQKGICVIVKDEENKEKCIWFLVNNDVGREFIFSDSLINVEYEYEGVNEHMPKGLPTSTASDASHDKPENPMKVEQIIQYKDGLCVEINDNKVIWFTQRDANRSTNPILRIRGGDKIKQIYKDLPGMNPLDIDKVMEKYGRTVYPTEDPPSWGGSRKRKSTKKRRKNTRRKNTRRKNTRRKNTRRKNTKRKKTKRKKTIRRR